MLIDITGSEITNICGLINERVEECKIHIILLEKGEVSQFYKSIEQAEERISYLKKLKKTLVSQKEIKWM